MLLSVVFTTSFLLTTFFVSASVVVPAFEIFEEFIIFDGGKTSSGFRSLVVPIIGSLFNDMFFATLLFVAILLEAIFKLAPGIAVVPPMVLSPA